MVTVIWVIVLVAAAIAAWWLYNNWGKIKIPGIGS